MAILTTRLHRLGNVQPAREKCLKRAVVILIWCEHGHNIKWPSYRTSPFTKSALTTYPGRPADLPASLLEAAYDYDDPPVEKFIDVYAFLGKRAPLRDNSLLFQKERAGNWQSGGWAPLQKGRRGGWRSSWGQRSKGDNSDWNMLAAQIH
eukprot:9133459-Pyramimonas_sp.AAC.1